MFDILAGGVKVCTTSQAWDGEIERAVEQFGGAFDRSAGQILERFRPQGLTRPCR